MSLSENGQAERVYGTVASANFFEVLGTQPHLGRLLRDEDDRTAGASPVTVISHELWQRRFGSDPATAGRAITLNGHPFTIVGITPRGFQGTTLLKPDLWVPMSMVAQATPRMSPNMLTSRGSVWLFMGGRLKPGVTPTQASAEATAIGAALEREYPRENAGKGFIDVPFAQQNMSRVNLLVRTTDGRTVIPQVRQILKDMNPHLPVTEAMPLAQITALGVIPQRIAAAVAGSLVVGLLLAGVGVYGVTAYAVSRRTREIGIRMALGADRRRVMRLVLRQALALAGIGVATGVLLAALGSRLLESLLFGVRGLDPITFASACGLFVLMTLAATYVPARRAMRVNPVDALRSE